MDDNDKGGDNLGRAPQELPYLSSTPNLKSVEHHLKHWRKQRKWKSFSIVCFS